jgi:hypothetical protein
MDEWSSPVPTISAGAIVAAVVAATARLKKPSLDRDRFSPEVPIHRFSGDRSGMPESPTLG